MAILLSSRTYLTQFFGENSLLLIDRNLQPGESIKCVITKFLKWSIVMKLQRNVVPAGSRTASRVIYLWIIKTNKQPSELLFQNRHGIFVITLCRGKKILYSFDFISFFLSNLKYINVSCQKNVLNWKIWKDHQEIWIPNEYLTIE